MLVGAHLDSLHTLYSAEQVQIIATEYARDAIAASRAAPAADIAAAPEQQQNHVAPPTRGTDSQHHSGLLGEILALASLGSSYGLLADNYCGLIVEKIKAAAPCAHCGRAPTDSESCDCTAGAAAIRALSDPEIVEVLASLGTDAEKSKYEDNPVLQVHTTVPGIREIVAAYIVKARGTPAEVSPPDGAMPDQIAIHQMRHRTNDVWCDTTLKSMTILKNDPASSQQWEFRTLYTQPAEGSAQVATEQQPIGFISRKTLEMLRGPDLAPDEHVRLWHAENPPSRALVPVFLAPERSDTPAPLYFVRYAGKEGWREASEEAYHLFSEGNRRILYATPTAASKALDAAPALDPKDIEWGRDLQTRLMSACQDMTEDETARQVMAEAACLLVSLTGRGDKQGAQGDA